MPSLLSCVHCMKYGAIVLPGFCSCRVHYLRYNGSRAFPCVLRWVSLLRVACTLGGNTWEQLSSLYSEYSSMGGRFFFNPFFFITVSRGHVALWLKRTIIVVVC